MSLSNSRRFGILLVLISATLWSTAGLFVRMAQMDVWSIIGWRSLFTAAIVGGYIAVRGRVERRGTVRTFGWPGIVSTGVAFVGATTYVAALSWTSVANVMTIYAALPFVATAVAFFWLGERVSGRFLVAGGVACAGIALTVGAAFAPRDLLGIAIACIMTLSFGSQLVIAKRHPTMDTSLMLALASIGCTLVALPFMQWTLPEPHQLLACAFYGIFSTGIGYILVLIGGRLVGSGEAGLLSMLDVVLGPLWVWLFFDERIGIATAIGGATVLISVVWYLSGASRYSGEKAVEVA